MDPQQFVIQNAEFLFGAPSVSAIRPQKLPEVAVIGRSNVGKSTFINRLAGRKVARVSGSPGSTRELNFYRVDLLVNRELSPICLVDMPGFGFAKLPKDMREEIARLSVDFISNRKHLRGVILLNDCRREPREDEEAIQGLCASLGIPCVIVLTKFDVLRQGQRDAALQTVASGFHLEKGDVLFTGEKISTDPIWNRIQAIL